MLPSPHTTYKLGLRSIAVFEAVKGLIALMAATGIALHRQLRPMVYALADHLDLDPAHDRPMALLHALAAGANAHLRLIGFGALAYAILRFAEAIGLWQARVWALWFGALSAALYLPFELMRLFSHPGVLPLALLILNGAVVYYLSKSVIARQVAAKQMLGRCPDPE